MAFTLDPSSSHRQRPDWDVIVVGAGVLGAFHAYFAGRRGMRTLLIERGQWPSDASVRNFGTLVPSAMTAGLWLQRAGESIRIYRELAESVPLPLRCAGTQYLATTPAERDVLEEFARIGPPMGYGCELLTTGESMALNPSIRQDNCLASLYFPGDARVNPRELFALLIPWMAKELGCAYQPRTTVVGISSRGRECRVLTSNGTEYSAGRVFICCGAELRTLFPERLAAAGLVRCKLQMARTQPQPSLSLTATIASGLSIRWYPSFRNCTKWAALECEPVDPEVVRRGIHVLMVQDADGTIVVGDSHEYSSGDLTAELDAVTESLFLREAQRLIQLPNWNVSSRWHGTYALHPDRQLFNETIEGMIHLVTAIGGKGMTTGPAVARESIAGTLR